MDTLQSKLEKTAEMIDDALKQGTEMCVLSPSERGDLSMKAFDLRELKRSIDTRLSNT